MPSLTRDQLCGKRSHFNEVITFPNRKHVLFFFLVPILWYYLLSCVLSYMDRHLVRYKFNSFPLGNMGINFKRIISNVPWGCSHYFAKEHYSDVIMGAAASQITSLTVVYSTVYSEADQRKHRSSASLAFVWGIHRGPVNSPHQWPVSRKTFPFDDVIMSSHMSSQHWFS